MAKFIVWNPESGGAEDGKMFVAYDAEEAAEKWAEREDSWGAEYLIVSGRDEPVVHVRDEEGHETYFKVSGESVPAYYAREIEQPQPSNGDREGGAV